jgi:hypothetical protein
MHEYFFRTGRRRRSFLSDGDVAERTSQQGGSEGTAGQGFHKSPTFDGRIGG